ncbi:uncharacterized protein LOC119083777 isoform X4 [Bradysia coprophila]|uniref:uncharacterized protein LOC119083777 isoform X4 n=1 Tax=Bradysia coprophila TaxID=38358 RepID=UPI00187DD164|nr:uncharacterized protein LOC119083777 isoform X4 [Bradysia coprophila]
MLGPNKWRLLTIVAGVLLAHAIDSPVRRSPNVLPRNYDTSTIEHAATIEHFTPRIVRSTARNLYKPYQTFSNVDNVRYIDKRFWTQRSGRSAAFGAFRYPYNDVSRRSDDVQQQQLSSNATVTQSQDIPSPSPASTSPTNREKVKRPTYTYIPLKLDEENQPKTNFTSTSTSTEEIQSRTDTDLYAEPVTDSSELFPSIAALTQDIEGRRSGIQFSTQSQKLESPFTPQSYREDNPNNPEFQLPYSEELSQPDSSDVRYSRQVSYDQSSRTIRFPDRQPSNEPFRDDVTKFGDVNGPVTVQHRQYSDYSDYIRPSYESYYSADDYSSRPPRQYFPPKSYVEYSDYPGPPRSRLTSPYKSSRTPRVVFPQSDLTFPGTASGSSGTSGSGTSGYGNDNVVFRDQNFGLNDLAAIQDVRNDFNLQDITDEPPATTKDRGCGISIAKQTAQRRIVGGDDAGFGSFPWQAYIRIGSSRCGGSLISRKHVVTAGHCVARASPRQVHVTLGDYVINSAVEPLPAYTFGVRKIDVHPYFKFTPQADRFDVSVLTLERPVHYMPHIAPICLPEKNEDFLGKFGWAAGWGALNPGSRLRPKTLQAVDVPVIENRICERWHRANGINVVIYPEMLCAGYRGGGKDSCQGDSGGPLMHEKNGRWYLIGVVSAGYSCATRGQPGIYHRVPYTVDWISYVTSSTT